MGIVGPKACAARMAELATELKLTDKQRTYADALLDTWTRTGEWNQTEAARVAKLGKDDVSCATQGSKMVRVPKVSAYLAALRAEAKAEADRRASRRILSASEVLERLSEHAMADMAEYITVENPPTLAEQAPHEQKGEQPVGPTWRIDIPKAIANGMSHLIKEISFDSNGMPKLKLVDTQGALDKLARYHGHYKGDEPGDRSTTNVTLIQVVQQDPRLGADLMKAMLAKPTEGKRLG
jgi:phage terminase small subunit